MNKRIEISGGLGPTFGKIWRIGTFGLNSNQILISQLIIELKNTLEEQRLTTEKNTIFANKM